MKRYVCVHGHFYQPPRENPWLEEIEVQDSAYPYHDWNERVTAECYAPNAASRILDPDRMIASIVNNYSRISFDFGPTLLSWMQQHARRTYEAVITADAESRRRCHGHGSAIAQAYNHIILPLASRRDKETQVRWGARDFETRFRRPPEGMWLPEAAVDIESLEILAEADIRYTILAPHQAGRVREIGTEEWTDVSGAHIDPSMAYLQRLPSGRSIALFFYDGPVSRAVAFENLLFSGEMFANRVLSAFSDDRTWPQLVHIATDGESYGHHHHHGDMALAYALSHLEALDEVQLTNYGAFLEAHPPTHEVEIIENSSWSCAHGIERWRSDCGCNSGGRPSWNQAWRGPMRAALDWLRDELAALYEESAARLFADPWAARDDYIEIILDRSEEKVDAFLAKHAVAGRSHDDQVLRLRLLEMQRHAMLMYTSCGWFFDDISGIEAVQVLQYAGRAVQIANRALGVDLEEPLLARLEAASSNIPVHGNGRLIYQKWVKPATLDLMSVGAHYAVSSLFADYPAQARLHCYIADRQAHETRASGRVKMCVGRVVLSSTITRVSSPLTYAAISFGDHNIAGGVREFQGPEPFEELARECVEAFSRADVAEVIRLFERQFGANTFSLRSLFRDEQRKILDILLREKLRDAAAGYRRTYDRNAPLMLFLSGLGLPIPKSLQVAAERALNDRIHRALARKKLDHGLIRGLLGEARDRNVELDATTLEFTIRRTMEGIAARLEKTPSSIEVLGSLDAAMDTVAALPFDVNLWHVENLFYRLSKRTLPRQGERAADGDEAAAEWVRTFLSLGAKLRVALDRT